MTTQKTFKKMVQERFNKFNVYSFIIVVSFCLLINIPGNINPFLVLASILFGAISGFVFTSIRLKRIQQSIKGLFLFALLCFSGASFAQDDTKAILINPREVIFVGDTLQLGAATLGNLYSHISYKYIGIPSLLVKRKGPLSAQYEGNVVFVTKVIQDKGLIVLSGIPYYKFECKAVKAFQEGEIRKFKKQNIELK